MRPPQATSDEYTSDFELAAEVEGAGRDELGHEHHEQVLGRVDPEDRRGGAAPHEVAGGADAPVADRALLDGDGEAEAHAVEADLAVAAGQGEVRAGRRRRAGGCVRHELDGLAAEDARAVELAAVQRASGQKRR